MNEHDTKQLLARYGVPAVAEQAVPDVEGAVVAAREIGYPVVLKILSADIAHKTEAGGVRLDIPDEDGLRSACAEVLAAARGRCP